MSLNVGAWMSTGNQEVAESMLSSFSYQWLCVDLEHTSITEAQASTLFLVCDKFKTAGFARLGSHNYVEGRRMLDLGASGVIVPVVEDAGKFEDLSSHFYYPPRGKRGAGLYRANLWGKDFEKYSTSFEPKVIAQIETVAGIENVEKIASSKNIGGLFLGPYDLSASLGRPGDFESKDFKSCVDRIIEVGRKHKLELGAHVVMPDVVEFKKRIEQGFTRIALGTDTQLIRSALKNFEQAWSK